LLFDVGGTLEHRGRPRAGAVALLSALRHVRDEGGEAPVLGLVSDYGLAATPAEAAALRREYLGELRALGLGRFFQPFDARVTLSSDVSALKPDPRVFRAALDKLRPGLSWHDAVFVTENAAHVRAARALGMLAVQVRAPGVKRGPGTPLEELLPLLRRLLEFQPCAKAAPLRAARHASVAQRSKKVDAAIQALVAQVDPARLSASVAELAAFGTRFSHAPAVRQVPAWVRAQLLARGYKAGKDVRYQPFALDGGPPQRNVLCGPNPKTSARGLILVCAHYDSISESPATSAPGADDDASGVAALIEIARLLRGVALKRGVLLAAFGGEEQGLFGSAACAEIAAREKWPIDLVVNMDMIAYKDAGSAPRVTVEYDHGNRHPGNDAAAKAFGLTMAQAARDYTSLEVVHTDIWSSDYMPFEAKGYACIGAYDADENPHYHKTGDTPDTLDPAHFAEVVRMVLATILVVGS
jgi:beta-phosphoglucomutase-like phosphatase (HAD superfamily)